MVRKILLNPGPVTTTQSVKDSLVVEDICPREKEFGNIISGISDKLTQISNCSSTHYGVLFTSSGTGALESVLTSIIPKGKKILIINNGTYGKRLIEICLAFNIKFSTYDLEYNELPDLNILENEFLRMDDFYAIAMVHHETSTGLLNNINMICNLAKRDNLITIVDAMSSFGIVPIDINYGNIDFLVSTTNKGIQGIPGISFVISNISILETVKDYFDRTYYHSLYKQYKSLLENKQFRFTPAVQVLYAMNKALDELIEDTIQIRWNLCRQKWRILYYGLKKLNFEFLLPDKIQSQILIAVKLPSYMDFSDLHDYMYKRHITIYPGKSDICDNIFRLSVFGDIVPADILYFLNELKEYINEQN